MRSKIKTQKTAVTVTNNTPSTIRLRWRYRKNGNVLIEILPRQRCKKEREQT